MGMYVQSNGTATPIPGGIPTDTLERIENDIAELRALRATFEKYGMAMITDSSAVTEKDTGLALWAGENNAGIEGTLANRIEKTNQKIDSILKRKTISVQNVAIVTNEGGAYYSNPFIPFAEHGISGENVISASVNNFNSEKSSFSIFYNEVGFAFMSDVSQTVGNISINVNYKE